MRRDALRMRERAAGTTDVTVAPDSSRLDVPQPGSANFNQRVRETLMTYLGKQGNFLDRGLTVRDLLAAGVISLPPGWNPGSGGGGTPPFQPGGPDDEVDLTPPPDVSGFVVTPGITVVFVETDPPTFTAGHGYLRTNIYGTGYTPGDPLPTFADAQFLFSFSGEVGSWATQPAATFRLWAKWQSTDGVESVNPVGGTNGVEVTTGQDVAKLVEAMTGPGKPFKEVTEPITLPDGTVVPVGVYISDAYIHRMQVVEAMVMDAAITNAKIHSLSASKIKAGSIAVGEYIKSSDYISGTGGWAINGDGTAEMNNVIVRGGVFASYGSFSGDISGATGTFSGGVKGGGYAGYAWPPVGQTGYYLGVGGLLLGNKNDRGYFQVEADTGNVYAPGFQIVGGNATFSGALNGTTGTFSGDLNSAGGTFTGNLIAANGTFGGNLVAAGGTFSGTLTAQVVQTANIVGAAISSTYSASDPGSSVSVFVPTSAGDRSLVIIADAGYCGTTVDTQNYYAPNIGDVSVNGSNFINGLACIIGSISDPVAGGYTITLGRSPQSGWTMAGNCTLVVLLTRR